MDKSKSEGAFWPPYLALTMPSALVGETAEEGDELEGGGTEKRETEEREIASGPEERLQILSPRIMQWDASTWILDMGACTTYWQMRAQSMALSSEELLHDLLQEAVPQLQVANAATPWRALLTLAHMRFRGLSGLVHHEGPFGQNLFRDLPWDLYWQQGELAAGHLMKIPEGRRHAKPDHFRRQSALMQRAVKRLGMRTPWQLRQAHPQAVKRRFGTMMYELWHWTYGEPQSQSQFQPQQEKRVSPKLGTPLFREANHPQSSLGGFFHSSFPWITQCFTQTIEVSRHLDHPLSEWSHIKPLLIEDFDRLCACDGFHAGERVVSLEWRIVFRDMTHLTIPILFRHPHSLHDEKTHHDTALLQALYAFESSIKGSPLDRRRLDELIPIEPMISWCLTITERLTLPSRWHSLFRDQDSAVLNQKRDLLALENRLSIPLASYRLLYDWVPEDSFFQENSLKIYDPEDSIGKQRRKQKNPEDLESREGEDQQALPSLLAVAESRPLYLFRKPLPIKQSEGISMRNGMATFTERTMAKWWEGRCRTLQRDYYRVQDQRGRFFWAYQTPCKQNGELHIHGVYG